MHTNYKLTHNLRDSICSSLMIYSLLRIFRLVCGFEKCPLLVTTLNYILAKSIEPNLEWIDNLYYKSKQMQELFLFPYLEKKPCFINSFLFIFPL